MAVVTVKSVQRRQAAPGTLLRSLRRDVEMKQSLIFKYISVIKI